MTLGVLQSGRSVERASLPVTVLAGLALASVVELLVLRTFTRTAIHIPAFAFLAEPYRVIAFMGRFAYFLSVALLLAALPGLMWALWRTRFGSSRAAVVALAAFAVFAGAAAFSSAGTMPLDVVTVSAVLVLAGAVAGLQRRGTAVVAALFAAAFALAGAHTLLQLMAQNGDGAIDGRVLLRVSELAGVAFAVASPLAVGTKLDRRSVLLAVLVGCATFAAFLGSSGSTVRILLLWNEGLSGTLPSAAYALAAGALTATFSALFRAGKSLEAIALALLVSGGLGLHNTYQSGLVLAGLATLLLAAWPLESEQPRAGQVPLER